MSIPRMNYRQYRKARKLTHECCNYCDGNCLLLDDGEECVCVQSISYSLLCRWFRAAVLPLDQPGQILPGLRGAGAPEERGRTAAAKILAAFREMSCTRGRFFQKDTIDYNYPREREVHSNGRIDKH